jgi:hypothetical protein
MSRWIFDNDEHFLRSCGIQPWPDYDNWYHDRPTWDEERKMELFSTAEMMNEIQHAFLNDNVTPSVQFPELTQQDFESEVRMSLMETIEDYLTFSTKADLMKFINENFPS